MNTPLEGLQKKYPRSAIIGGVTSGALGIIKNGEYISSDTDNYASSIAIAAMRGTVPLRAIVTRGVEAISPSYYLPGVALAGEEYGEEVESTRVAVISKFADAAFCTATSVALSGSSSGSGSASSTNQYVNPAVAIRAAGRQAAGASVLTGVRYKPPALQDINDQPFVLKSYNNFSMVSDDKLVLILDPDEELPEQIQFFKLTADACKVDVKKSLQWAKECFDACDESVMAAILFTCSARGPEANEYFFREEALDARTFRAMFPNAPLIGSYVNGEIGPLATVSDSPRNVLRTGKVFMTISCC